MTLYDLAAVLAGSAVILAGMICLIPHKPRRYR